MIQRRVYNLMILALGLVACATDEEAQELEVETVELALHARAGSVIAEFGAGLAGTSVHAQFIKAEGITREQALDALDMWSPDHELAIDACSLRAPDALVNPEAIRLQLLDVGAISVSLEGDVTRLESRRLPDMLSGISGVVYGNDEGHDFDRAHIRYEPAANYRIEALGGERAGAFRVQVQAPFVPEVLGVESQDLTGDRTFAHIAGTDVQVSWLAQESSENSRAALYLDIASTLGPDRPRLRCRLEDDGDFQIPENVIEQMRDESANLEVILRRVHGVDVDIEGLDSSEVLFVAKDGFTLTL